VLLEESLVVEHLAANFAPETLLAPDGDVLVPFFGLNVDVIKLSFSSPSLSLYHFLRVTVIYSVPL